MIRRRLGTKGVCTGLWKLSDIESLIRSSQTYVIFDSAVRDVFPGEQAILSKKDEGFFRYGWG